MRRRQGQHDRCLAAELIERRGKADVRLRGEISHREIGPVLSQKLLRSVEYTLAQRLASSSGRRIFGLDADHSLSIS
jgi:hypothetical protein